MMTLQQQLVKPEIMGRYYAVTGALGMAATPLGQMIFGALFDTIQSAIEDRYDIANVIRDNISPYTATGEYLVTLTAKNLQTGATKSYSSTISIYIFAGGLISNGNFESGTAPWTLGTTNAIGTSLLATANGNTYFSINVAAAGNAYDVNLSQKGISMTQGVTYRLTFDAWSDVNRSILVGIGLSGAPWTNNTVTRNLTTTSQSFSIDIPANFTSTNSRVIFDLGAAIGKVNIDNVTLNALP